MANEHLPPAITPKSPDAPKETAMPKHIDDGDEIIEERLEKALMVADGDLNGAGLSADAAKSFFEKNVNLLSELPKAKAAKVVRGWVDTIAKTGHADDTAQLEAQIALCQAVIGWSVTEKRSFLNHRVQVKLGWIYLYNRKSSDGLAMMDKLSIAVKKLEEKVVLVEVHLIQSKMHHQVKNIVKAKAALTACRANANAVHISAALQAEIDFMGGVLAAAEAEYHVAHSYFQEAHDSFATCKGSEDRVAESFALMLLMKLMNMKLDEYDQLAKSKTYLKLHSTEQVSALLALGGPVQKKDLSKYKELRESTPYLIENTLVKTHLIDLEERLLEEVLTNVLSAYSKCDIDHLASVVKLDRDFVHRKLTTLILDEKIHAYVAEDEGVITLEEKKEEPVAYRNALQTIRNLSTACDVIEKLTKRIPQSDVGIIAVPGPTKAPMPDAEVTS